MIFADFYKKMRYFCRKYANMNNFALIFIVFVSICFVCGTISTIDMNFGAQKRLDDLKRKEKLVELEVAMQEYEKNYYKTDEYKDLAARQKLGLASPGEKVLILPANSPEVKREIELEQSKQLKTEKTVRADVSNFQQWIDFLSGKNASQLKNDAS